MTKLPTLARTRSRIHLMRRILGVAWQVRPWGVIGFFIGAIVEIVSFIVTIYATAKVGSLLAQFVATGNGSDIWLWLWVDIIAGALTGVGQWLMSASKRYLYFKMLIWSMNKFQSVVCTIDIPDFYDTDIRDRLNKVSDGYNWQISNFNDATLDLIYAVLRFLATAIIVAQITWWLIPLLIAFLIPSLIFQGRLAQVQWFIWNEQGDDRHIFWGLQYLMRIAGNQMELRSSQAIHYVLDKVNGINSRFYGKQEKQMRKFTGYILPSQLLEAGGTAIGSIYLLKQFLGHVISLDRYFFLSGALLRVNSSLANIFGTLSRMQQNFLFMDDFFAVLDIAPKIVDKPDAVQLVSKEAPEIAFKNVSFTYPGQTKPVFKNLSFTIHSGERLAIVGENGAGKSTLIKLLLRFYRPSSGRILINGIDLQDLAIESWYDQLATLFQSFNQYPFPIDENIEVARPEFKGDQKRLEHAAKMSNVDVIVKQYKHGWDTVLDNSFEKGVEPSGGQWQRVALARAFYRQANVLILDEPTAAIDAKAEYDIFNNIFAEYKGKTAIIVSHRFSTVRKADRILVFEHGKVIEDGTHKELIKLNGEYADMFNKQAEGYR